MTSTAGITPQADFTGAATNAARIDRVIALLPDNDTESGSGSIQGGAGYLDEMSPVAAAQMKVELLALKAALT